MQKQPADGSAAQVWRIGNTVITRVIEDEYRGLFPGVMFDGLTPERVREIGWLSPHYVDADGHLAFSIHAYVIESEGRRIIVDTCIGNDKARSFPLWNQVQGGFLSRLAAAGLPAESIDLVLCTHLHVDHVGWNTYKLGDRWLPTFPNARYLWGRVEWNHWNNERERKRVADDAHKGLLDVEAVMADSIQPIVDAGLHTLVESDHQLTSEVRLIATPGHTPGHVSVVIESQGRKAIITGDMLHHPVQIADSSICSILDDDSEQGRRTRTAFIEEQCGCKTLVLGTHFAAPCGGRIVRDGTSFRFEAASESSATQETMA